MFNSTKSKKSLFEFTEKTLSEMKRLKIVGDIHGDFTTLQSLCSLINPAEEGVIFLGDYADRGDSGIEVINRINSLINKFPENIVAVKGNHEDYLDSGQPTFSPCDLIEEAERKRAGWQSYFSNKFKPFVNNLFIAVIVPNKALFVHGGVSNKLSSLNDLKYPSKELERDIIWSDPIEGTGEYPSRRGAGVEFGIDVSIKVCKLLKVNRIIRSHEPMKALRGPCYEHEGRVITVSSTRVYGGKPFILNIDLTRFEISYLFL